MSIGEERLIAYPYEVGGEVKVFYALSPESASIIAHQWAKKHKTTAKKVQNASA